MIIHYDPKEWVTEVKHGKCPHHTQHPGTNYAGCTCWSSYMQRKKNDGKQA